MIRLSLVYERVYSEAERFNKCSVKDCGADTNFTKFCLILFVLQTGSQVTAASSRMQLKTTRVERPSTPFSTTSLKRVYSESVRFQLRGEFAFCRE